MATKKRTAPATSSSSSSTSTSTVSASAGDGSRLELTKAIHLLSQRMEGFDRAAESLAAFSKDALVELDMQIEAKSEELARRAEENEHAHKRMRTETTLFLAEFRYEGACAILAERGEMPVPIAEHEQAKASLLRLTAERERDLEVAVKSEKDRGRAALEAAVQMRELNHKAQTAELAATTNQQIKEIGSLNQTIANLKEEVAQQRKLTEAVANAGRPAPITLQTGK